MLRTKASGIAGPDVFFLSSVDDPQPLACLEALALGKRAVVYSGTGSSEVLAGLAGCRVFSNYSAEEALMKLEEALSEEMDVSAARNHILEFAGVEAFQGRLESAFDDGG